MIGKCTCAAAALVCRGERRRQSVEPRQARCRVLNRHARHATVYNSAHSLDCQAALCYARCQHHPPRTCNQMIFEHNTQIVTMNLICRGTPVMWDFKTAMDHYPYTQVFLLRACEVRQVIKDQGLYCCGSIWQHICQDGDCWGPPYEPIVRG